MSELKKVATAVIVDLKTLLLTQRTLPTVVLRRLTQRVHELENAIKVDAIVTAGSSAHSGGRKPARTRSAAAGAVGTLDEAMA